MRNLSKIIFLARREGRVKKGVVICENCDNPADKTISRKLSWTACGPCATGESSSLDLENTIPVPRRVKNA